MAENAWTVVAVKDSKAKVPAMAKERAFILVMIIQVGSVFGHSL